MNTPSPAYRATADPCDLISYSIHRLTIFQAVAVQKDPADSALISHWLGNLVADLSAALHKLEVCNEQRN